MFFRNFRIFENFIFFWNFCFLRIFWKFETLESASEASDRESGVAAAGIN